MKVLIIGNRIPWPLHDGGAIATYYMLKGLSENGINVTYLTLNPKKHFINKKEIDLHFPFCDVITLEIDTSLSAIKALLNLAKGGSYHIDRFTPKSFFELIKKTITENTFDIIHFENLFSAGFAKQIKSLVKTPLVLRQHNVESAIWEKLATHTSNPFIKKYLGIQAKRLKKFEQDIIPVFNAVVPIAKTDEIIFKNWCPKILLKTIPASIPIQPKLENTGNINHFFHIGSMEWLPNKQGVEWFLVKVWPLVRAKNLDVSFHFAGKNLDKNWRHDPENGIYNHGEVANAAEFMSENGAMIVPLLSGSGIRIKTIEAMSIGKPVISTTTGAAGLDVEHGKNILLADDAEIFAENVLKLIQPEIYKTISTNAQDLVKNKFYYLNTSKEFILLYNKLLE